MLCINGYSSAQLLRITIASSASQARHPMPTTRCLHILVCFQSSLEAYSHDEVLLIKSNHHFAQTTLSTDTLHNSFMTHRVLKPYSHTHSNTLRSITFPFYKLFLTTKTPIQTFPNNENTHKY